MGYSPWGSKESDTTERLQAKWRCVMLIVTKTYCVSDVVGELEGKQTKDKNVTQSTLVVIPTFPFNSFLLFPSLLKLPI